MLAFSALVLATTVLALPPSHLPEDSWIAINEPVASTALWDTFKADYHKTYSTVSANGEPTEEEKVRCHRHVRPAS